MSTSVGMKARKKQQKQEILPSSESEAALERAIMTLESVCARGMDEGIAADEDSEYWHHRFKNIITPVSLALAESKGPRQFHYHYRHSATDDSILEPVLEPAADMLARVCEHALEECAKKLVGIRERDLVEKQRGLESALRTYLMRYKDFKLSS